MTDPAFRIANQTYDPEIPVDAIAEHPDNYNQGDVGAIGESLDEHGYLGAPILVQKSTGLIMSGNHTHRTAKQKGATHVGGFWVDCDDDEAYRIMSVINRSAALAVVDEARLVAILKPLAISERGLAGTGYDGDDLDDMIAMLAAPSLDQLGERHGEPGEDDFWPVRKIKLSPAEWSRFDALTSGATDTTDAGRMRALITMADSDPCLDQV